MALFVLRALSLFARGGSWQPRGQTWSLASVVEWHMAIQPKTFEKVKLRVSSSHPQWKSATLLDCPEGVVEKGWGVSN